MSRVSVIVPIYNAEKTLDKCIKSILHQTFNDFELVLINDGSMDESLKICKNYENKDRRILVIDKENEGSISTRRKGVESSNSKYIMFVDADDWISSNTIEVLYKETINSKSDITVCNMYKVLGNRGIIRQQNKSSYFVGDNLYVGEEIKKKLVIAYFHGHPFPSSLCAKLYKTELLLNSGKYLDRIKFMGDDLFYNLEIFLKVNRVKIIEKPYYNYRLGGFTSKYMPYLFEDIVSGYLIQKEVIAQYFQESFQKQSNGISIMLLNSFKTCLYNLFNSEYSEIEIKNLIKEFLSNESINEATSNEGSIKYFQKEYLDSIRMKDVSYLFELGKNLYKKSKPRKAILNIISKASII